MSPEIRLKKPTKIEKNGDEKKHNKGNLLRSGSEQ